MCCAAAAMAVGQIIGLAFQTGRPVEYVLRVYVLLQCFLVILIEFEWTSFARESKILQFWVTRGIFYAFIGVLGLDENDTLQEKNQGTDWFDVSKVYIMAVAWVMVACGCLYFSMGIFCVQMYYNKLRTDYEERLKKAPEIRRTVDSYRGV